MSIRSARLVEGEAGVRAERARRYAAMATELGRAGGLDSTRAAAAGAELFEAPLPLAGGALVPRPFAAGAERLLALPIPTAVATATAAAAELVLKQLPVGAVVWRTPVYPNVPHSLGESYLCWLCGHW